MKQNELYTEINKVIYNLLSSPLVYEKSWLNLNAGLPKNSYSHKMYKGVNLFMLSITSILEGWANNTFMTYKQIHELGGKVKKGSHTTPIYFYDVLFFDKNGQKYPAKDVDIMSEQVKAALGISKRPYLKKFRVFNIVADTENLPEEFYYLPQLQIISPVEINQRAHDILISTGAEVRIAASNSAHYSPQNDIIQLPDLRQFKDTEHFYSVVFHELAHWTGHNTRLNRKNGKEFGDRDYAFEELVAELASAYVCGLLGFQSKITNNAAYIKEWLKALDNEPRFFVKAARKAEEAAAFILKNYEVPQIERFVWAA
ncbi:zincin-like metallopeptidase domain-containing protein [Oscillatoria amoena NRMC-F 0135]|nr:zincin-like metallopeptidase domain-containing protein [Oscillatoria amoena NRMC-F 0135]